MSAVQNEAWLPGRVVSGFGGFYQVLGDDGVQRNCKGRGRLKKEFSKIYTGDRVLVSLHTNGEDMIESILPRRLVLPRPQIANVELAVIVLSWHLPDYDLLLLDNLLLAYRLCGVQTLVCFNKCDLMGSIDAEVFSAIRRAYGQAQAPVLALSAESGEGVADLLPRLKNRLSVLAGPSGAGKSSLLNRLIPGEMAETGQVSNRLRRGRHTTRYTRLLPLPGGGMVADAPGFFVLDTPQEVTPELLPGLYPEYAELSADCRFDGCRHHKEPGCAVRQAVEAGRLDAGRYQRYQRLLQQLLSREDRYR